MHIFHGNLCQSVICSVSASYHRNILVTQTTYPSNHNHRKALRWLGWHFIQQKIMFLFMAVTVYSVNACHQTYWLLPLPVVASHRRTQSHPAGILRAATECRSLSAHRPLILYVLYLLPAQLTSCSAAVSHGKGCVVIHTQITSVDLWGWAFLPVQERQEQPLSEWRHWAPPGPAVLGLCWQHRQVKDTHPCCQRLCTSSCWGWHQRRDSLEDLDTLISSGTPMNKVTVGAVFRRKNYGREIHELVFRDNALHLDMGKKLKEPGHEIHDALPLVLKRSWFSSGRRDGLQGCIIELCSDSAAVAQTMPYVSF